MFKMYNVDPCDICVRGLCAISEANMIYRHPALTATNRRYRRLTSHLKNARGHRLQTQRRFRGFYGRVGGMNPVYRTFGDRSTEAAVEARKYAIEAAEL